MYVYNMDYEKKYLKYKSKYNLKKSSLVGGGEKIMKGGNIGRIAALVYNNVPMTTEYIPKTEHDGWNGNKLRVLNPSKKISETQIEIYILPKNTLFSITDDWIEYIDINTSPVHSFSDITISFKPDPIDPEQKPYNLNTPNQRGQTLLYLAAQNCNKQMFDTLVAMGADPMVLNSNSSSILHGIAWGKLAGEPGVIATDDEKNQFMEYILKRYPQTISLLFTKNSAQETYFDNLLMRHPEKISTGLKRSMLPINPLRQGWLEQFDNESQRTFYADTIGTGGSIWDRPSLWVIQGDTTPYYYNMDDRTIMSVEQFNLTYKEPT